MNYVKPEITGRLLKNIAIITMITNHVCVTFMNAYEYKGFWYYAQWYATRVSFVIFTFLISEGMYKTHSRTNYMFRLALMALLTEIPYDLCFNDAIFVPRKFNIGFTLFFGALAIDVIEKLDSKWKKIIIAIVFLIIGYYLSYGIIGIGMILSFYFFRRKPILMFGAVTVLLALYYPISHFYKLPEYDYNLLSYLARFNLKGKLTHCELLGGIFAYPLIALYKGKKGNVKLPPWFFYFIYPGHIILLLIIKRMFL